MDCPKCGLTNPASAFRCDCGYDFSSREVKDSYLGGKDTKYTGVAGWLLFFCISLTILNPLAFIINVFADASNAAGLNIEVNKVLALNIIVGAGLAIFSMYTGIKLWRVSRNAVKTAKVFLICLFVIGITLEVVTMAILQPIAAIVHPIASTYELGSSFLAGIVHACVYTGIWYAYLSKAHRVKTTYGIS